MVLFPTWLSLIFSHIIEQSLHVTAGVSNYEHQQSKTSQQNVSYNHTIIHVMKSLMVHCFQTYNNKTGMHICSSWRSIQQTLTIHTQNYYSRTLAHALGVNDIILLYATQIKPDYRVLLQARTKWCALQCTSLGFPTLLWNEKHAGVSFGGRKPYYD